MPRNDTIRDDGWTGLPPDPAIRQWHWLQQEGCDPVPAMWDPDRLAWAQGGICCGGSCPPEYVAGPTWDPPLVYVGPCPFPATGS